MTRFSRRPGIRTWLCSGIVLSCAVLPVWSQDQAPPAPIPLEPSVTEPNTSTNAPLVEGASIPGEGPSRRGQPGRQSSFLEQTSVERQRSFMDATRNAEESEELARDAFEKGLMPLQDYADQARTTLEIRLSVASLQRDRAAQLVALTAHADAMRSAAKLLEEFEQPAATGWASDVAYAALLTANAELRLAAARGDRDSYTTASARSQELAEAHYTLRETDFNDGLASLPSLSRAASFLTTAIGLPSGDRANPATADAAPSESKFADYLETLKSVVEQTTEFAELGAGVGREDRIHQAKLELAKAEGQLALQQKDLQAAAESFDKALEASQDMFRSQVEFHETGTASLREVADAWWSRVELVDLASRAGLKTDSATAQATETDLEQLNKLVDGTEDREGRIEADVAYVKSLESLQGLWAREQAVATLAARKATTPIKTPTNRPRVLELGNKPEAAPAPEGTKRGAVDDTKSGTVEGATGVTIEKTNQTTIEVVRPKRAPKK